MPFLGRQPTPVPLTSSDITDGIVTTAKIADDAVGNTKLDLSANYAFTGTITGAGNITHIDNWRLTSAFSGGAIPISSNLEQVDTAGQTTIGSAMTFSSGIFTFPVTGKWLVQANYTHYINGSSRYQSHYIMLTTDNSNYTQVANMATGITHAESDNTYDSGQQQVLIDVTDTSLVKVKFELHPSSSAINTVGSSTNNSTYFTFIRFGDT